MDSSTNYLGNNHEHLRVSYTGKLYITFWNVRFRCKGRKLSTVHRWSNRPTTISAAERCENYGDQECEIRIESTLRGLHYCDFAVKD
jgi:hypothetical protein